jgi:hypothetical protein
MVRPQGSTKPNASEVPRGGVVYIFPGRSNGAETEVLPDSASGQIPLTPGDIVLVEGHLTLTHDAPVRVIQKAEQGKP